MFTLFGRKNGSPVEQLAECQRKKTGRVWQRPITIWENRHGTKRPELGHTMAAPGGRHLQRGRLGL